MDKKSLFIIIPIVVVILFYWQILEFFGLYEPPKPVTQSQSDTTQIVDTNRAATTPTPNDPSSGIAKPTELVVKQSTVADSSLLSLEQPTLDTAVASITIDTIRIQTKQYDILCSNRGGGPISIKLRQYTKKDSSVIDMLPTGEHALPELRFAGSTVSTDALFFTPSIRTRSIDATSSPAILSYTYTPPTGGARITKRYTFHPESYSIGCVIEFENASSLGFERDYRVMWQSALPVTEPEMKTDMESAEVVAWQQGNRVSINEFNGSTMNQVITGDTRWCGVRSKYFTGVLMATTENVGTAAIGEGTIRTVNTPSGSVEEKRLTAGLEFELASGVRHKDSLEIFVGPLDYTLLDKYPDDLEGLLDIGTTPWVGWIVKPFALAVIWLLPLMYAVIPNYGVCIILFALLIKLLTLPLSLKTFKSMAAMRDMGPKLEKLKLKYKDNPQALTSETMKLYKDAGVNPFSGCLPMLAQMPIFFALFSVFRSSILLRHAPFVGFVNDLSHGASSFTDPYIILVVLMIGAQFLSSFITSSNQPQQNKMFLYIFPVIMGFMFYSFSAGLVLYWTAFSLFSLIDWYIFRSQQPKNAHIQEA